MSRDKILILKRFTINNCIQFILSGIDLIAWMMKSMDIDDQGKANLSCMLILNVKLASLT